MSEGMHLALRLWCLTLTLKLLLYQIFTSLNLSKPFNLLLYTKIYMYVYFSGVLSLFTSLNLPKSLWANHDLYSLSPADCCWNGTQHAATTHSLSCTSPVESDLHKITITFTLVEIFWSHGNHTDEFNFRVEFFYSRSQEGGLPDHSPLASQVRVLFPLLRMYPRLQV